MNIYTLEELKWDILILQGSGIGNDLKGHPDGGGCPILNLHRYKSVI